MAAARESLSREQIAAAADLDAEEESPVILSRLASFMPASEGRYAFFHKSMSDWLTGWDSRQDQPFAGAYHVDLQRAGDGWRTGVGPNISEAPRPFLCTATASAYPSA